MDTRPVVMRQWRDRKAISQSAPQEARKQGGDCNAHRTNARMRRSERTEWTGWAASSSEEPEATRRPDRRSQTREREPRPNPGENTQERTGIKSNRTQTMERTGRLNPHGNPKSILEGRRHWIRQETDRSTGGRKANSPVETAQKRLHPTETE